MGSQCALDACAGPRRLCLKMETPPFCLQVLRTAGATSVRVAALLDKRSRRKAGARHAHTSHAHLVVLHGMCAAGHHTPTPPPLMCAIAARRSEGMPHGQAHHRL